MADESAPRSNILAITLVVAVLFQTFLSVLILSELRNLPDNGGGGGPAPPELTGLTAGTPAPEFLLPDSAGEEVALSDLAETQVMLIFSSDQCKYCKRMYPEIKRFQEERAGSGLQVVMLQMGSTPEENRELARDQGFSFPILVANQDTFGAYQVPGTPFSTVIDAGRLVTATGVISSYEQMAGLVGSTVAN